MDFRCVSQYGDIKKDGVFAFNDDMKPKLYGDMEAFAEKLRDIGYRDVCFIDTA